MRAFTPFLCVSLAVATALPGCSDTSRQHTEPRPAQPAPAAEPTAPPEPAAQAPTKQAPNVDPASLGAVEQATLARAKASAQAFGAKLKGALMEAMQTGGPVKAMDVCSGKAQQMTQEAQGDDVALGRSSLRLRNPENQPPAWVQAQLEAWGERPAEGLSPVVQRGERDMRVMIPLAVEGPCLMCHGPSESLAPAVKAALDEHYPDDRATGYAVGDLRGVLWAIARLEPDPAR